MIRRTRILATLGPASREPAVLDALFAAGLDAVRLNFSHGTHETHAETSLENQARLVAMRYKSPTTTAGYWESGQFWRLREVGATLTLPTMVNRALRTGDASLTVTGRNLHVWTAYTGTDPESNYSTGNVQTDFSPRRRRATSRSA